MKEINARANKLLELIYNSKNVKRRQQKGERKYETIRKIIFGSLHGIWQRYIHRIKYLSSNVSSYKSSYKSTLTGVCVNNWNSIKGIHKDTTAKKHFSKGMLYKKYSNKLLKAKVSVLAEDFIRTIEDEWGKVFVQNSPREKSEINLFLNRRIDKYILKENASRYAVEKYLFKDITVKHAIDNLKNITIKEWKSKGSRTINWNDFTNILKRFDNSKNDTRMDFLSSKKKENKKVQYEQSVFKNSELVSFIMEHKDNKALLMKKYLDAEIKKVKILNAEQQSESKQFNISVKDFSSSDIKNLTEKIYIEMVKKIQFERQRMGIFR